jgi:DNA invertase Pin-like site-specific DNA recombinase
MKPKRVALYMRVSTGHQNVALQRDGLLTLCRRHSDWTVSEYVDNAISGKKNKRPALDKLMDDCQRGKIDIVVVWKFDRFARSLQHLLEALDKFQKWGVEFMSIDDNIDTRTAAGKMTFQILGAVAEFEHSLIIERVRAGQAAAKRAGQHIGRSSSVTPVQRTTVEALRAAGNSVREIATKSGLSKSTIGRLISETA